LRELLELRTRLSDLRGSLQGNDKLEELLQDAITNTEKLGKLKEEVKPEENPMPEKQKPPTGRSGDRAAGARAAGPDR